MVTLSDDDVSDIESVLNILKPIKTVTTILCEEELDDASTERTTPDSLDCSRF